MMSSRIVLRRIVPVWVSRVKNPKAAKFACHALVAALMMLAGSALMPAASADQVQLDASLTWHAGGTACEACSLTFDVSLIFDNVTGQIMPGTLSEQVIGPVGPATLTPMAPMNTFSAATEPHCGFGAINGLGDGVVIDFYESLGFCQRPIQQLYVYGSVPGLRIDGVQSRSRWRRWISAAGSGIYYREPSWGARPRVAADGGLSADGRIYQTATGWQEASTGVRIFRNSPDAAPTKTWPRKPVRH
jgi:hypothetical protein